MSISNKGRNSDSGEMASSTALESGCFLPKTFRQASPVRATVATTWVKAAGVDGCADLGCVQARDR